MVRLIQGAAHHLDLREPNDADPADLKAARTDITTLIQKWINDFKQITMNQEIPEPITVVE
jgi:hypothetical protein